jgi:sec-independent protein translocase protein TatA
MHLPLLAMLNTPEIIALMVLALILFGAKKLPELARGLGHGIKEFKKATRDVSDEIQNAMDAPPPPPSPPPPMPPYPGVETGGSAEPDGSPTEGPPPRTPGTTSSQDPETVPQTMPPKA